MVFTIIRHHHRHLMVGFSWRETDALTLPPLINRMCREMMIFAPAAAFLLPVVLPRAVIVWEGCESDTKEQINVRMISIHFFSALIGWVTLFWFCFVSTSVTIWWICSVDISSRSCSVLNHFIAFLLVSNELIIDRMIWGDGGYRIRTCLCIFFSRLLLTLLLNRSLVGLASDWRHAYTK